MTTSEANRDNNERLNDFEESVACQLCDKTFSVVNLRWHILKEHCHDKISECSICEKKFITKDALKVHIRQVHLNEGSACHICKETCDDLDKHIRSSHSGKKMECPYCDSTFQGKKLLNSHIQSTHLVGEKSKCKECQKEISVDNLGRHMREQHERIKKPCPHCEKEFAMSNLARHVRQVHDNQTTQCPFCNKTLSNPNLNKHIKTIHKRLKKSCDICNEELPYSIISVHRRKAHNIGKPFNEVSPRGPNTNLRKRNAMKKVKNKMEMEEYYLEERKTGFEEIQVGDKKFTFSVTQS